MGFKKKSGVTFLQTSYGSWGSFKTASGTIHFLETKARIGSASTDPETRLTNFLKPVREALKTENMDFNQLMQRDLDDHRVATELVPYLLERNTTGPAFFPPIVAALLPFKGLVPEDYFPDKQQILPYEDEMAWWAGYSFGESFKFEKIINQDHSEHKLKVGRILWNEENTQIVVIDGQHRAMALLAIYRTIQGKWEGNGDKYRHFYEPVVEELLDKIPEEKRIEVFSSIELPVNLLWFPEIDKTITNHQKAARKLFVDVNKNARVPSESRILLLSDSNLSAYFTRKVLNTFRDGSKTLPIYSIEYDHPERDQSVTSKWSTISNVSIIHNCLYRAVFGPQKYIADLKSNFRGKENIQGASEFMRETLKIVDVIPSIVDESDRTIKREDISDIHFPRTYVKLLEDQLMKSWGYFTVRMLSDLLPYKMHGKALDELRDAWAGADSISRLAKDSLFEGVGMYWTLRDSYSHWSERNRIRQQSGQPKLTKSDIVSALDETEIRKEEFEKIRANHYLGSKSKDATEASKGTYSIFSTHACQLGFVLAGRSLVQKAKIPFDKLIEFTDVMIAAANAALTSDSGGTFGRKVFLWKGVNKPINLIPKLDTPFAVYFRYFWLELLASPEAKPIITKFIDYEILKSSVEISREHYLEKIKSFYFDSLKNANSDWKDSKVEKEAAKNAIKDLSAALSKWFGMTKPEFDSWHSNIGSPEVVVSDTTDESNDSTDTQDESEGVGTIEELLKI